MTQYAEFNGTYILFDRQRVSFKCLVKLFVKHELSYICAIEGHHQ